MSQAKLHPLSDLQSNSIARAFAVSLMVHFTLIAAWELGRTAGWWNVSVLPAFNRSRVVQEVLQEAARREEARKQEENRTPEADLLFMDVDPAQAVAEPPKNAKYYSAQNTLAANRESKLDLDLPQIDGKQDRIPKTADTLRPDPRALQPEPAPPEKQPEMAKEQPRNTPRAPDRPPQEEKPELKEEGEMLLARAAPKAQPKTEYVPPPTEPPKPRPRTLAEARAQRGIIEAPKMRQEGGVRRLALDSGLDVKATPFGAYDAAFIAAVQARWFNLLDERDFLGNHSGKVVVEFNLNRDGRITEMRVIESTVPETLAWVCQRAVLDPAPYRPFPPDLRRMLQRDYRPVRFTFYYNQ